MILQASNLLPLLKIQTLSFPREQIAKLEQIMGCHREEPLLTQILHRRKILASNFLP